ncbi:SDR family NAD(P)-dependent oxidoreductase [Streptomyces cyaneofuscatus]|uniref:SDR family NAD(P)-dependent oxidoreductase n=1 Tax=Streptomyces cyaneofuscatus TaxID=66883 RepID=UPI0036556B6B
MAKVFLVTGSSRGLGREIVTAALAAGHGVMATARDPRTRDGPVAAHDDRVRAALEDTTPEVFRRQVDTNFRDTVYVSRAVVPALRRQGGGGIIQISSLGSRIGSPGMSAYHAAKRAVGGLSESLAAEVAPLGVKLTVLEPGCMWTEGAGSSVSTPPVSEPYRATVGAAEGGRVPGARGAAPRRVPTPLPRRPHDRTAARPAPGQPVQGTRTPLPTRTSGSCS